MVFTVSCPECSSEFPVDSAKVPAEGVYAQCSVCPGVFMVERPTDEVATPGEAEGGWAPPADIDAEMPDLTLAADPDDWMAEAGAAEGRIDEGALDDPSSLQVSGDADEDGKPAQAQDEAEETPRPAPAAIAEPGAFGHTDPDARAARLARVLVSDMMTYNPAMYEKAVEGGTLAQDFEDEVKRSWSEYVEQVGEELARSSPHFIRALNDILAKGEDVFDESMYL